MAFPDPFEDGQILNEDRLNQILAAMKTFGGIHNNTATESGGSVTLNEPSGIVTTESLTTAAGSNYDLTVNSDKITASSVIFVTVWHGTNTSGTPWFLRATPSNGSCFIQVRNAHASAPLNGTLKVAFIALNPA